MDMVHEPDKHCTDPVPSILMSRSKSLHRGSKIYQQTSVVYRARSKRKTTEIIPLEDKLVLEPGEGDTFEKFPLQSPLRLRTLQTSKTVNLSRVSAVSNFQIQKSIWNHQ